MTQPVCIEGIDPGAKGGVAFLWPASAKLLVVSLPVFKVTKSRTFTYVDADALVDLIEKHTPSHGYLERVHSMPHDGAVGAFTFGDNFGSIKGSHARRVPLTEVEPAIWKANLGATSDKKQSLARAKLLFPACAAMFTRPDLAEAAMIALYGCFDLGFKITKPITPGRG